MPNIFTPNGDAKNNRFKPVFPNESQEINEWNLKIFNRWGQVIFASTNVSNAWDGSENGAQSPEGVYYFTLIYKLECTESEQTFQGSVELLR